MSISGAISTALSGLAANASRVASAAYNIANVGTTGFKAGEVRTTTLVTRQSPGAGFSGGGVTGVVRPNVSAQGLLVGTGSPTDLAVAGAGFFVVADAGGGRAFTRAGSFTRDDAGFLVNTSGHRLLGFPTDAQGVPTTTTLEPVNPGRVAGTASATRNVAIGANLPAGAADGDSVSLGVRVTDSLGNPLDVPLTITKAGVNRHTITIGDPVAPGGGTAGSSREGSAAGSAFAIDVIFGGDGSLLGFDMDRDGTIDGASPPLLSISGLTTGAADLDITLDLGGVGSFDGLTQFAGGFTLGSVSADGARFGTVDSVSVGTDGTVTALFNNGERRSVFVVPLATFANPDGLEAATGNVYRQTDASGQAIIGSAASGGAGTIEVAALEQSTTDLGVELTRLILARVAYKANLEALRTGEEMLRDLIDIKG